MHRLRHRSRRVSSDAGFTLVEVLVAVVLLAIVLVAVSGFFVRGAATATMLQRRQAAVALADEAMELIRSVPPAAPDVADSPLVAGRSDADVHAQWSTAPRDVRDDYLAGMRQAWDTAPVGSTPTVPLRTRATVSDQPFTIDQYLGLCYRATTKDASCTARSTGAQAETRVYRAVVVVSWDPGAGGTCGGSPCRFVLASLLDPLTDPLFMLNGASVGGAPADAREDSMTVPAHGGGSVNVKSNDLGTLGYQPVSIQTDDAGVLRTGYGAVTVGESGNGALVYRRTGWSLEPDSFTYTLTDAQGRRSTGTVTVTVQPPATPVPLSVAPLCLPAGSTATVPVIQTVTDAPWGDYAVDVDGGVPAGVLTRSDQVGAVQVAVPATATPMEASVTVRVTDPSGQTVGVPVTARVVPQETPC